MELICLLVLMWGADVLESDEVIQFYPTYAWRDVERRTWNIRVHAKVYEPERDSAKRAVTIGGLRRSIGISKDSAENRRFERRLRSFLVDAERGKQVYARIFGRTARLPKTDKTGHTRAVVRVSEHQIRSVAGVLPGVGELSAVLPRGDSRVFRGAVRLIPPRGVSIISDIDDTIKVTSIADRREMLANTFLRSFRAVPGMAGLYANAAERGALIHYVSGSPWALSEELEQFLRRSGFPAGPFDLRQFRVSLGNLSEVVAAPEASKEQAITRILQDFPQRRFVLIGDSGERDPEIYGRFARKHPRQVVGVLIRNVNDESRDDDRMVKAFAGVPRQKWYLSREVDGWKDVLTEWLPTETEPDVDH